MINPDEWVVVRNIPVRRSLIDMYKQKYGGVLVVDKNDIMKLDASLAHFRHHKGRDPEVIHDQSKNHYMFEEVTVPLHAFFSKLFSEDDKGSEVKVPSTKPIWFKISKIF